MITIKITFLLFSMLANMDAQVIYDFTAQSDNDWYVVDDVVMGGRSNGDVLISSEGHAVFSGVVSLENNGGFSSIRYRSPIISTKGYSAFKLRIKGDGKNYQFRVRSSLSERQAYIYEFETTGEWQDIEIPFHKMYPGFRGVKLDLPNYPGEKMQECSFLISNKKNESFRLEIDKIRME